MSDSVKFIFKTLLKVPIIIFVSFFILNIFAFFFIYFKVLGTSYVVMQVAVENNYLPASELMTLYDYVDEWNDIPMVNNASIIVYDDGTDIYTMQHHADTDAVYGDLDARTRKQYGKTVTCGVRCEYTMVWPLDYRETTVNEAGVNGLNGNNFQGFKSEAELEQAREDKLFTFPIEISYTVPGLKYYPDMLTY
jgi:hypothetical protein